MAKRKHPIQPVELDDRGAARFRENKIVRFLLDAYTPGLNDLAIRFGKHTDDIEDYEHLMMLIGYSVSGFGDLDINRRTIAIADRMVERLVEKEKT